MTAPTVDSRGRGHPMMTPADLATLRYRAHAFEAQNFDGLVCVPQKLIRLWEHEILELHKLVAKTP